MMKKSFALCLVALLALVFFSGGESYAQNKTVWKVAAMGSDTHPATIGAKKFKEEIEKRIGGEVEVQIFPNGQLGTMPDQQIGGLQNGIIQFCDISTSNVAEFSRAFIPLDVPYLFMDRETAMKVVDGEVGQKIKERYEKEAGIRLVCFFDYGFREITNSKRPINSPEDMKGLKIRTLANPIHLEAFKKFGALPTTMAYSELMPAMQQGTIDGQENPTSSIWDAKMYEVQKYLSMTDHVYGFLGFHMSAQYYNSLPDNWKKAIDEAAKVTEEHQRAYCDQENVSALQKIQDSGETEVNIVTTEAKLKFRELATSSWDMAKKRCGEEYFNMVAKAAGAM
jgi:tripartite ATP-independent transporter DctP family solute receptor